MFKNLIYRMQCNLSGFSWCRLIPLLFIIMLLLMALSSCTPDSFMLNKYKERSWVKVKMLNGIEKAEKINQNSFRINKNAIISLKILETTQYSSEFDLQLTDGNEIDFYLFTTEYDFEELPYLKIILTDKNYRIEKEGKIIAESDSLRLTSTDFHRIRFHQEMNLFRFKFDCAEIAIPGIWLKASEYIIIRTPGDSRAILRGLTNTENYIKTESSGLE